MIIKKNLEFYKDITNEKWNEMSLDDAFNDNMEEIKNVFIKWFQKNMV